MIGHQLLLQSGDSISRILPVEKEANQYKIRFESEFGFDPEKLVSAIDGILLETKVAQHYLVEVKECNLGSVVYSYERGKSASTNIVPCLGRVQPEGCYYIVFTLLETTFPVVTSYTAIPNPSIIHHSEQEKTNSLNVILPLGLLIILILMFLFYKRKGYFSGISTNMIALGEYKFDKHNMELHFQDNKTELTGKEAELLLLLHSNANSTIDRSIILKEFWGDDGDYVGRTLDVYISKLRKKLEADSSLKIVNIRGIGYKLILNLDEA